jgi:hypothetical protein
VFEYRLKTKAIVVREKVQNLKLCVCVRGIKLRTVGKNGNVVGRSVTVFMTYMSFEWLLFLFQIFCKYYNSAYSTLSQ